MSHASNLIKSKHSLVTWRRIMKHIYNNFENNLPSYPHQAAVLYEWMSSQSSSPSQYRLCCWFYKSALKFLFYYFYNKINELWALWALWDGAFSYDNIDVWRLNEWMNQSINQSTISNYNTVERTFFRCSRNFVACEQASKQSCELVARCWTR